MRLNGIYEVEVLIGAGGMGEVYKGRTIHTGDPVAIKILRPEFGENEAALGLFRKEASALHNLHHEAIVRYYVCSVDPDLQRPYLAMEFVEGQSLSQLLRQGPLTFEAVRNLARRVSGGLHAAHERGIVHRDVAPDNVIIPGGDVGRAKIIDFGIARFTQTPEGTIIGGGFAGKYKYVSPEQLGLFGGDVTPKSDIYSLGLVLFEALTGQAIDMGGSQAQVVEKRRKLPDLGGIDMRLRPLLEKMLQPDPLDRPESMLAVAAWANNTSAPETRNRSAASLPHPGMARTRGWMLASAAVALLAVMGAGAGYYYYLQPQPSAQAPPPPAPLAGAGSGSGELAAARPPALSDRPIGTAGPSLTPPGTPPPPALSPSPSAPPLQSNPATAAAPPPSARPPEPAPRPADPRPSAAPSPAPALTPAPPGRPTPPSPGLASPTPPQQSNPAVALAPPSSRPSDPGLASPQTRVNRIENITRYIADYDGGECFFITPISVGEAAARIEGFGASVTPFQVLDDTFKRANGFEADIGIRQVTVPQCPAITFLGRLRAQRASAPQLEISETNLRSGQALTGNIDGYGNRHIDLLLISDDGSVHNLSRLVKTTSDGKTFNLRLQLANSSGAQPQMLIAIASAQPLSSLQLNQPADASQVFPAALNEVARTNQTLSASARYFKLE